MCLEEKEIKYDKSVVESFEKYLHFIDGRYVARLLWKPNHESLSNNFENAKRRLNSLANKLRNDKWLRDNYDSIINNQLNDKIIEECENLDGDKIYYMPQSPVVRKNACKTKLWHERGTSN